MRNKRYEQLALMTKRHFTVLLCLFFCLFLQDVVSGEDSSSISLVNDLSEEKTDPFSGSLKGSGSASDPYQISSVRDLVLLRQSVDQAYDCEGLYFLQTADLYFEDGFQWDGIGDVRTNCSFAGVYDGAGHTLSNIVCTGNYAGFFELLDGEVRNLGIESGSFTGDYIGSIASHGGARARIINCYNKADVHPYGRGGGICDDYFGEILFTWSLGSITDEVSGASRAAVISCGGGTVEQCFYSSNLPVGAEEWYGKSSNCHQIIDVSKMGDFLNDFYDALYDEIQTSARISRKKIAFLIFEDETIHFATDTSYTPDPFLNVENAGWEEYLYYQDTKYSYDGGDGSSGNPFRISSYETLCHFRDCVDMGISYRNYYFVQTEDIVLDGEWEPIGEGVSHRTFAGSYDGDGHTISNLNCNSDYAGLFAYLGGEVRNLGIESGQITGKIAGTFASLGTSDAFLINCYAKTQVEGTRFEGSIAAYFSGNIENCYAVSSIPLVDATVFGGEIKGSALVSEQELDDLLIKSRRSQRLGYAVIFLPLLILLIFTILFLVIAVTMIPAFLRNKESVKRSDSGKIDPIQQKPKRTLRSIMLCLLTGALCTGLIWQSFRILDRQEQSGEQTYRNFTREENQNADVLFVGGSSMSFNVEIAQLWKEYGIAAYCIGSAYAEMNDNYYRLVQAEKVHSIKNVVVEVRSTTYTEEHRDNAYYTVNISALPLNLNKLKYIKSSVSAEQWISYILDFPLYHANYDSISAWNFSDTTSFGEYDKGTWSTAFSNDVHVTIQDASDYMGYRFLDEKQETYLRKIIEFCMDNDINLTLLKTPEANLAIDQPFYNTVSKIAEEYGIPFLNMNDSLEEIGMKSEDWAFDRYHLTVEGARKCADFLGSYLLDSGLYEDHREENGYESWELFSENREDLYLSVLTDLEQYAEELRDAGRTVYLLNYKGYDPFTQKEENQSQSDQERLEAVSLLESLVSVDLGDIVLPAKEDVAVQEIELLDDNRITLRTDYDSVNLLLNEKAESQISGPAWIFVIYDDVMESVCDIVSISGSAVPMLRHYNIEG